MSLKQVSEGTNIQYDTLRNKMSGRTEFTREEMYRIKSKYFQEYSIDYLFSKEDVDTVSA